MCFFCFPCQCAWIYKRDIASKLVRSRISHEMNHSSYVLKLIHTTCYYFKKDYMQVGRILFDVFFDNFSQMKNWRAKISNIYMYVYTYVESKIKVRGRDNSPKPLLYQFLVPMLCPLSPALTPSHDCDVNENSYLLWLWFCGSQPKT